MAWLHWEPIHLVTVAIWLFSVYTGGLADQGIYNLISDIGSLLYMLMAWHHEAPRALAAAEQTWFDFNHQIEAGSSIGSYQDMRAVTGLWKGA